MGAEHTAEMQRAWTDYLDPLERDYPDHQYKAEVAELRQKYQADKTPSEAQRFFQQGEMLAKQGDLAAAQKIWRSLIDVFGEVEAEKLWVKRAQRAPMEMENADIGQDRFKNAYAAMEKAEKLQKEGKHADADRIWSGIEQLYGNDPTAENVMKKMWKARQKK